MGSLSSEVPIDYAIERLMWPFEHDLDPDGILHNNEQPFLKDVKPFDSSFESC